MSLKHDICICAALVHHADPSEVSEPHRVGMMLECNTGDLLARTAFMHHDDQDRDVSRYDTVRKWLHNSW